MKINKKLNKNIKRISALALVAQGLISVNAIADEGMFSNLEKSIDIGGSGVTSKSYKFGEYNGMETSRVNAGFDLQKGLGEVDQWSFKGTDLGTTSRNVTATMTHLGKWNAKVGYDELRHNISDTYQTPQQGEMGGNVFNFPTNFGTINGASSASATGGTRGLNATQLSDFSEPGVHTDRKNTSLSAGYIINPNLNVQFDFNHLSQSGAKLLGTGAQGGISLNGSSTGKGESVNIIMNPTKYNTETFNLDANWHTEKGHLSAGYYGSMFKNDFNSVSFQNSVASAASTCVGAGCFTTQRMSTAPDNSFHQLNLTGTYELPYSTSLTAGLSYGRNTQDKAYDSTVFAQDPTMVTTSYDIMQANGTPALSLNGLVVSTHGDFRLTNQMVKDLTLTVGTKYNKRDDLSASKTYNFKDIADASRSAINAPYSNSSLQSEVAGDYRLTKNQKVRLAVERETIKRWCNNIASGAQCIASPKSDENKFGLTYRMKVNEDIKFNTGYTYSNKQGEFDHGFLANIGNATTATGNINAGDKLGFESRLFASRQEHLINAGASWQATESLDFAIKGRLLQDKYEAVLGVQQSNGKSATLDSTYVFNDKHQVSLYSTWSTAQRDLRDSNDGTISTTGVQIWTNRIKDEATSVGLISQHAGLLDGKMEVTGDVSYTIEGTKWSTTSYLATCATSKTCGDIEAKTKITAVKLTDSYKINKNSKVSVGYIYQHLSNDDFFYNIYQNGYTPTATMPTNEQAPSFNVSMITAMYSYFF